MIRILLAAFLVIAGSMHFIKTDAYLAMMPSYVPFPEAAIAISGFFEVLFGVLILIPRTRSLAKWGIILLLVAVFPANIEMALRPERFLMGVPAWTLWARLPFQFVFIAWAWKAGE